MTVGSYRDDTWRRVSLVSGLSAECVVSDKVIHGLSMAAGGGERGQETRQKYVHKVLAAYGDAVKDRVEGGGGVAGGGGSDI